MFFTSSSKPIKNFPLLSSFIKHLKNNLYNMIKKLKKIDMKCCNNIIFFKFKLRFLKNYGKIDALNLKRYAKNDTQA